MNTPEQLTILFKDDETNEFYQRGLTSGLSWDADWMPGGPHLYTFNDNGYLSKEKRQQRLAMAAESKYNYELWHRGFKTGLERRMIACPAFAAWFKAGKHPESHHRYVEPVE